MVGLMLGSLKPLGDGSCLKGKWWLGFDGQGVTGDGFL
jgi:hypothetical protein